MKPQIFKFAAIFSIALVIIATNAYSGYGDLEPHGNQLNNTTSTQTQLDQNIINFRQRVDQIIQQKLHKNLQKKIFRDDAQGNFLFEEDSKEDGKRSYLYDVPKPWYVVKTPSPVAFNH